MKLTYEQIAEVCHENNRAYCHAQGDYSQLPWRMTSENLQASVLDGVKYYIDNPGSTPEQSHENWLKFKKVDGWKYGPVKDAEKKEHPCFLDYGELPSEQRMKDHLFIAVVDTLRQF